MPHRPQEVRLGLIGLGVMGRHHATTILGGKVPRLRLAAAAEPNPEKLQGLDGVRPFASPDAMIASGEIDAVLIATPHFQHTPLGIQALKAGLHVLMEKPISVHKADAQRLIAAHRRKDRIFAAMFNQRTDPYFLHLRDLIVRGELGEIRRVNWTITNWFRTEHYYSSGSWRATWAGEGGGVLLNQCPHNLDLLQWLFGLPKQVRAFCHFGRYHDIEVEDDVTAYLEFPNGATGVFTATTGEAPGTNRLEVAGERGRVVYEKDQMVFTANEVPMSEFSRKADASFAQPATRETVFSAPDHGPQHRGILQNFTDAILDHAPLLCPAAEGIRSLELANAMLLSSWTDRTVQLPMSARTYAGFLKKKIAASKPKQRIKTKTGADDLAKSFAR